MSGEVTIRPFETIDEYRACVDLQEETWGVGFSERVSPAILKVSQILGGVAAGAYDARDELVGFVFGMTGLRGGEVVHWSDMLAVRPEHRDSGLGRRLKAYQRERVLALGVHKMYWTFDPLRSRNAYLNFARLGIVVREYVEDMYGQTDSPLHRGIGTDRFVALWLLDSERVRERIARWAPAGSDGDAGAAGNASPADPAPGVEGADDPSPGVEPDAALALGADLSGRHPAPGVPELGLGNARVAVQIPSDISAVMAADADLALDWRWATRAAFQHYLDAGYEVRELLRGGPVSTYLVERLNRED